MTTRRPLVAVVAEGDYRESLQALRDHLAVMLDAGDGNAATAKQLTEVLKLLEALPTGKEHTIDDELAARRAGGEGTDVSDGAAAERVVGRRRGQSGGGRRARA